MEAEIPTTKSKTQKEKLLTWAQFIKETNYNGPIDEYSIRRALQNYLYKLNNLKK